MKNPQSISSLEDERYFAALAENLPRIVYMCRNDEWYSFIYISGMCREMLGYEREEFLSGSISFRDIIHPGDYDGAIQVLRFCTENRRPFYLAYRIRTADGQWRWYEDMGTAFFEGDAVVRYAGIMLDVTPRLEMERQLRESDKQYRELVEHVYDIVYHIDADGVIRYINGAITRIMGYYPAELIGKKIHEFIIRPENLAKILPAGESFDEKNAGLIRLRARDGSDKYIRNISINILAADGTIAGYQGLAHDATWEYERERFMLELILQKCSPREREVLQRLATGMGCRAISRDLHVLEQAVYTHISRVKCKLKTDNLEPILEQIRRVYPSGL